MFSFVLTFKNNFLIVNVLLYAWTNKYFIFKYEKLYFYFQVDLEMIFLSMTTSPTWSLSWIQKVVTKLFFPMPNIFFLFQVRSICGTTSPRTSDLTTARSPSTLPPAYPRSRTPWQRASTLVLVKVRNRFIGPVLSCQPTDKSLINTEEFLDLRRFLNPPRVQPSCLNIITALSIKHLFTLSWVTLLKCLLIIKKTIKCYPYQTVLKPPQEDRQLS